MDQHEPAVSEVAGDLDGIASVGLLVLSRPMGNQGGSGELAGYAPVGEPPLKDGAGAQGFVADARAAGDRQPLEVVRSRSDRL